MCKQRQGNGSDCGVLALAFAASLLLGQNPSELVYEAMMRQRTTDCFQNGVFVHSLITLYAGEASSSRR